MTKICAYMFGFGLMLAAQTAHAETYNLRNSCDSWEFIPANEALSSPAAALLTCTDKETGAAWLALQVLCFADQDMLEIRYQSGYEPLPVAPVEQSAEVASDDTITANDGTVEVAEKIAPKPVYEMLSFLTSSGGYHHAGQQDETTGAWHVKANTIHYPLFLAMARANFIDVALGPVFDEERLPLRGSSKALAQVKQACKSVTGS